MKPRIYKSRIRRAAVIGCAAVFLFAAASIAYILFFTDKLADTPPQIEYGQPLPSPDVWFSRLNHDYIIANADEINTSVPGEYRVLLQSGKKTRESSIAVLDKTPPAVTARQVYALLDETLTPEAFIAAAEDASPVTYTFADAPDTSRPGTGSARVTARDASGNEASINAEYTVISVKTTVSYACESEPVFSLADITDTFGGSLLKITSAPEKSELCVPGTYEAVLDYHDRELKCAIEVLDTTPPAAKPKNLTIYEGQRPEAIAFCAGVTDMSEVTAAFAAEPDWTRIGQQTVAVVLTDSFGNTTELSARLTIKRDAAAPKILGTRHLSVMKGEKIAYRRGVIIKDNSGAALDFTVDSSGVDINTPGKYKVIYRAEDLAGNVSSITRTVRVDATDVSLVDEYVDAAIEALALTGSETGDELLHAVYDYVRAYLKFATNQSDDGLYQLAYQAFKTGKADCRGYLAMSSVLFDRLGIENREVHTPSHKWNIVKIDGKWWFYDATERFWEDGQTYKFGRKRAEELTQKHAKMVGRDPFYYVYDKTLYPDVEA
ncbi:MAG: DUF5011 domain-containing protein [Oscillospiraceae bacterium]|jgi:hypothetical protein|nr:DUF5011 domain-containing protein [Oscillospiraceae bacterium]